MREAVAAWPSDAVLFFALQLGLLAFAVFAAGLDAWHKWRAGQGNVTLSVTRGDKSMAYFYGAYGALSGVLVALSLSADVAKDYRVLWTLWDLVLVAYVCLLNSWFRNKLAGWVDALQKRETR
jgi:hypothetical protein